MQHAHRSHKARQGATADTRFSAWSSAWFRAGVCVLAFSPGLATATDTTPTPAARALPEATPPAPSKAQGRIELGVNAGKVEEICMPLKAGETLHWQFSANVPVDFNLHHHVGKQVVMPVLRKATRQHSGQQTAEQANEWCLMWTAAPRSAAVIEGQWRLENPSR